MSKTNTTDIGHLLEERTPHEQKMTRMALAVNARLGRNIFPGINKPGGAEKVAKRRTKNKRAKASRRANRSR